MQPYSRYGLRSCFLIMTTTVYHLRYPRNTNADRTELHIKLGQRNRTALPMQDIALQDFNGGSWSCTSPSDTTDHVCPHGKFSITPHPALSTAHTPSHSLGSGRGAAAHKVLSTAMIEAINWSFIALARCLRKSWGVTRAGATKPKHEHGQRFRRPTTHTIVARTVRAKHMGGLLENTAKHTLHPHLLRIQSRAPRQRASASIEGRETR